MEGLELRKAVEEAQVLKGARLSKAHQVGDVLFLRFFGPSGALVLDPKGKAFHLTALRPPAPPEPPPFCQKVREFQGQRLLSLDQIGFERVIRLSFQDGEIILDLRPRQGNIFILRGGKVTNSLREGNFAPIDPETSSNVLLGMGPSLKHLAQSRGEDPKAFGEKLLSLPPRGFLYRTNEGLLASFFPRDDLGTPLQELPSFWEALDRLLEERLWLGLARKVLAAIDIAIRRREKALFSLRQEEEEAKEIEKIREKADLIMARISEIAPGEREVTVEDFSGHPVTITLDPSKPPLLQAQELYEKAKKLKRKLSAIPERRRVLEAELERLFSLKAEILEKPDLVPYLSGELKELGAWPEEEKPKAEEKPKPKYFLIAGFPVFVGRSAEENDEIVRKAKPDDIWLHARGIPGAHVLIRSGGREVPEEVLRRAAELAAWFSKARGERKVEVSYTEARYVRKPKGSPKGMVVLLREKVLVVSGEEAP